MSAQTSTSFKGVVSTPGSPDAKKRRKTPRNKEKMYHIDWPPYDSGDVKNRIDNVLGPLSLFAPFPHEDEPETHDLELERPNTPVDKEIRSQPSSFEMLSQYIRRRITPKPGVLYLSYEDQQNLAGIIMGEVTGIWPDIKKQIDDPFLTEVENKELNRRIAVHIVTVCEKLFHHYLRKAQVLNSRGVFSGPANMSRLKVQLALETNNFLNILRIRRYIVADIRAKVGVEPSESEEFYTTSESGSPTHHISELSYQGLIQTSRPKSRFKKPKPRSVQQEIKEMTSSMPKLDTSNLMDLVEQMPDRLMHTPSEDELTAFPSRNSEKESRMSDLSSEESSKIKVKLKRSRSAPVFHLGETLLEELGISADIRDDPMMRIELTLLLREQREMVDDDDANQHKPKPGTLEHVAEDLKQLLMRPTDIKKTKDDLPPLLQAIVCSTKHDDMKERKEKEMKELVDKEKKRNDDESVLIRKPRYVQPATVNNRINDELVVKTADTRVSERVSWTSMTLKTFPTIFNDLTEEVNPDTMKELDQNLFYSDEIREVYKEIMTTVTKAHLLLDYDGVELSAPVDLAFQGTTASASLSKRRHEWVINPKFCFTDSPPWGDVDPKEWVRTPENPPKNFSGEDIFPKMTPDPDRKADEYCNRVNIPECVAEKMAHHYSSWLEWWKSTVNSDDYMKYLSTQDSDFLSVIFHFYDEDAEDDYDDDNDEIIVYEPEKDFLKNLHSRSYMTAKPSQTIITTKAMERRQKEQKLQELRLMKTNYKKGFWNVNTVLMGGLGKEAKLEDDSLDKNKDLLKVPSAMTIFERAAQIRQSRLEAGQSRSDVRQTRLEVPRLDVASRIELGSSRNEVRSSARSSRSRDRATSRMSRRTYLSSAYRSDVETKPKPPTPQERLEKVWTNLHMPDSEKLDMALKYSGDKFFSKLNQAIDKWEAIAELILQREDYLKKLEKFERKASDPNRFFQKGEKGSSRVRLQEARRRSNYYMAIDILEKSIKMKLDMLQGIFKDTVTYKGRQYLQKMKWDRVEMLYYLQEERKQHAIKYEQIKQTLNVKNQMLILSRHQHERPAL